MKTSTKIVIAVVSVAVVASAAVLLWLFVFRTNYKDAWWDGISEQRVVDCGVVDHTNCDMKNVMTRVVAHVNQNGNTHKFSLVLDSWSDEAEGECYKDDNNMYDGVERYCLVTGKEWYNEILKETWRRVYLIVK